LSERRQPLSACCRQRTPRYVVPRVNNNFTLVLVVIVALAFDFTNGFHDTGNAMATSIATGALPPRVAVVLSGALNRRPLSPAGW
jgi:hypothetical protein